MRKMKKILTTTLVLVLVTGMLIPTGLHASEISVTVDGVAVDFEGQGPAIVDGRTLVPVRGVFEALGFEVGWHQGAQIASLSNENYTLQITIGNETFVLNGGSHNLDVPAQIIEDRTMLPIRAVLESVGYFVDWDNATRTVLVSSTPFPSRYNVSTGHIPEYISIRGQQYSTSLTELSLTYFGIRMRDVDIIPLQYMVNLTEFSVPFGQLITDISPLAGLTNLEVLRLQDNQISDITPLAQLTNLTELRLDSNQIDDISILAGLMNLTVLNLADNQITSVSSLWGLRNLTDLRLDSNLIRNIGPLSELTNLEILSLHNNMIDNWIPVEHVEAVFGRP